MAVDRNGKLWFATEKGVISYDGNDIKVFDHQIEDSLSLPVNSTGRLYFDDSDNLYIWSVPGQIYLNTKTGKATLLNILFRDKDKSKLAFPYQLSQPFIDGDASIWVGMYGVGFIHYSRKTKETTYYTSENYAAFKANTVYVIQRSVTDKNILWLATDNGIYSFNKTTQQLTRNFESSNQNDSSGYDPVIVNMDAGKDTIWFTIPWRGVGCYDIKSGFYTIFPYRSKGAAAINEIDISFFQRKNSDEYYISAGDKLPGTFNIRSYKYSFATKSYQDLPAIQLRHFVADSNDRLWSLIFYQLHRAKLHANKIKSFRLPVSKTENKLENDFKTSIWDNTNRCYYVVFDSRNEVFVFDENLKLVKIIPIEYRTAENNLMASRLQIGTRTDPATGILGIEEPNIFDIGLDENGRLWLCGTDL
jgi:hypothetical protein